MDSESLKRKRTPTDDGREKTATATAGQPGNASKAMTEINYLVRAKAERLHLIEGDADTFADVLGMIDDYDGVLQRHESLAANLGAKLVGPLLLKSFEKLFDGPIKVIQADFEYAESPITWYDIVNFARTNPSEFFLSDKDNMPGYKVCRFWIHGGEVEISEDDYRLVMSGAPARMIPTQAMPEDEAAELGTLMILESRLAMLIKKADAVASKARQLNYHLKGRKVAVLSRRPEASDPERTFSPQPFSAVNASTRSAAPQNGESARIQQQLLEQFMAPPRRFSLSHPPSSSRGKTRPSHSAETNGDTPDRRSSTVAATPDDGIESQFRLIMAAKLENLNRGDPIYPPCDRCRRLGFECTKHLTACQACTKKHAKCSWRNIQEGELDSTPTAQEAMVVERENGDVGTSNGGKERISLPSEPRRDGADRRDSERKQSGGSGSSGLRDTMREHLTLATIASAAAAAAASGQ